MIDEKSSVESVLEKVIAKVELRCSQEGSAAKRTVKRKLDDSLGTSKRRKLSLCESVDEEILCRICYDATQQLPVLYLCKCKVGESFPSTRTLGGIPEGNELNFFKGTMGAVHLKCLERWLEESNRNSCELCGHQFVVRRTPRYHVLHSIVVWLCLNQQHHQLYVRSLRADLIRSAIITPMAIGCAYLCIIAADFYAKNNYDHFPPARWTVYLLLAMVCLLLFSYFLWMYMAIEYHQKVWFYWWQKTSTVRIVLDPENRTPINYKSNISQV